MSFSKQVTFSVSIPAPERVGQCEQCQGDGVRWKNEEKPTSVGHDGKLYCKGWMEVCSLCQGEGAKEKKKASWVDFSVGKSITISQDMIPYDFARNTPENLAWKIGTEKATGHAGESAWMASNGVLLIVHGDRGHSEIVGRKDIDITPSVEAKYYAWLCPGVLTGPYVELVIEALNEYNAGAKDA